MQRISQPCQWEVDWSRTMQSKRASFFVSRAFESGQGRSLWRLQRTGRSTVRRMLLFWEPVRIERMHAQRTQRLETQHSGGQAQVHTLCAGPENPFQKFTTKVVRATQQWSRAAAQKTPFLASGNTWHQIPRTRWKHSCRQTHHEKGKDVRTEKDTCEHTVYVSIFRTANLARQPQECR